MLSRNESGQVVHTHGHSHHRAPRPSAVHIFAAQSSEVCHLLRQSLSVCLSVRPPVTVVSHTLTVQDIEICFAPHDKGTFLVPRDQIYNTEFRACGSNDCVKQRHPLATVKIRPIIHHISETCKIGRKFLLCTQS